jgi:hypothetical protein
MNPEFLRNIWLEATPLRLALIAGLTLLMLAAGAAMPFGLPSPAALALGAWWFFVVLWGTRNAALSVVGEIRERTWDSQKLSSIAPFEMVWGKLFGATLAQWFGGAICLPFILAPVWIARGPRAALTYGVILVTLGVFAQSLSLLASLNLIRRSSGNWRLDTFLCQVAGIGGSFFYYSLWSSLPAFVRSGLQEIVWWGFAFSLSDFHLVSLLLFTGWSLVGCWRAMRAELRLANGPYVWLAWLTYLSFYQAGFAGWLAARMPSSLDGDPAARGAEIRLALTALALAGTVYSMVFLEPKDPVRLRWLGERIRRGDLARAFHALDAWMLSWLATMIAGLALAAMLASDPLLPGAWLMALAGLGFLTRDAGIFVLMRPLAGARGDFAALAILGALYLLLPTILPGVAALLLPVHPGWLGPAAALAEAAIVWALVLRKLAR